MVTYRGASNAALSALSSIPFENIIAGPLEACIRAQKQAAETTVDFIQSVGLEEKIVKDSNGQTLLDDQGNPRTEMSAIYVSFQFIQGGRLVQLNVPLLALVPIPYIAINTIDINFKANITATTIDTNSTSRSYSKDTNSNKESSKGYDYNSDYKGEKLTDNSKWNSSTKTNFSTQISSKKDSAATRESKYSVEYTMDVAVHASQDSMPAGMAKVLEMMNSAMDLSSAEGELIINANTFDVAENGEAELIVSYKMPNGLIDNSSIVLKKDKDEKVVEKSDTRKEEVVYRLTAGTYKLTAKYSSYEETITVNVV